MTVSHVYTKSVEIPARVSAPARERERGRERERVEEYNFFGDVARKKDIIQIKPVPHTVLHYHTQYSTLYTTSPFPLPTTFWEVVSSTRMHTSSTLYTPVPTLGHGEFNEDAH